LPAYQQMLYHRKRTTKHARVPQRTTAQTLIRRFTLPHHVSTCAVWQHAVKTLQGLHAACCCKPGEHKQVTLPNHAVHCMPSGALSSCNAGNAPLPAASAMAGTMSVLHGISTRHCNRSRHTHTAQVMSIQHVLQTKQLPKYSE
jgi:hypothetical protein